MWDECNCAVVKFLTISLLFSSLFCSAFCHFALLISATMILIPRVLHASVTFALCFSPLLMSNSFAVSWTVACQAPLSLRVFWERDYWSGLPVPPPEDLPGPGIVPTSLHLLHCCRFFTIEPPEELLLLFSTWNIFLTYIFPLFFFFHFGFIVSMLGDCLNVWWLPAVNSYSAMEEWSVPIYNSQDLEAT